MSEATKQKRSIAEVIGLVAVVFVAVSLPAFIVIPSRVRSYPTSPKNRCINNLRSIDWATQQWVLDHNKAETNMPTWEDLKPYLCGTNNLPLPSCPSGGTYTPGSLSNVPTCSISGHVLP